LFKLIFFIIEKGRTTLPAGISRFPFSYTLPADVPSTFVGAHGKVRYKISAVIDKPWAIDEYAHNYFTVAGILDLNAPEYVDFAVSIRIKVERLFILKLCGYATRGPNKRLFQLINRR
jgi:Arrestin (or S-antigen), N-terminal domain